jgi:murein DD-endopeptidase MepM/ murein hydrolase activator NlpD
MQERRPLAFKIRRRVRRSIRYARRRSALTIAIAAMVGISAIAFASGVGIGLRVAALESTHDHFAHHADHEHAGDEAEEEDHSDHADHAAHEGSGGPELPARPINTSLAAGEQMAKTDTVAWETFPGRSPVDDAHIGSTYGNRVDPFKRRVRFHSGIDFVANKGTPIRATAGGRVSFAGKKPGYGNLVEIDHGNGLVTRYAHASRLVVRKGDQVTPRQHVADVGSTGRSTGPHLHFELLENGAHVDPAAYLEVFAKEPGSRGLSA